MIVWNLKWEKVEDKYAIGSLAFAGVVALWGSTGLISVRGVFENRFKCNKLFDLISDYFVIV